MLTTLRYLKKLRACCTPSICILCHQRSDLPQDLCQGCKDDMPILPQTCPRCAKTFTTLANPCGECLRKPPPFDAAFSLFSYQKPITNMIMNLKFQSDLVNAKILGAWMAETIINSWYRGAALPEVIIPMPLHAKRLRERGFNQSLEIARPIAHRLKLPLDLTSCARVKATAAQAMLPAEQRGRNIKNAFSAAKSLQGLHIALLDDVTTTGYSMAELAKTCKKAGARRIDVWYCARAVFADI
jgi:ComF family protein